MASVFRSLPRSDHRFPCRDFDLSVTQRVSRTTCSSRCVSTRLLVRPHRGRRQPLTVASPRYFRRLPRPTHPALAPAHPRRCEWQGRLPQAATRNSRGRCKRPDRHRKRLTAPKPMAAQMSAGWERGASRQNVRNRHPSRGANSLVHRARQRGYLSRRLH